MEIASSYSDIPGGYIDQAGRWLVRHRITRTTRPELDPTRTASADRARRRRRASKGGDGMF